jgi:hypothetical protein
VTDAMPDAMPEHLGATRIDAGSETAGELRAAFDRAFAEAPVAPVPHAEMLAIHAGGVPFAIARNELAALRVDLAVVALPSPAPALLGVTSLHGQILPVWDLGRLIHGEPARGHKWCAIVRDQSAALAFDRLDAYLRVPAPVGRAIEHAGIAHSVVGLAGLLASHRGASHGR